MGYKKYMTQLFVLTTPILVTQLSMQSTSLVDTLMTGRVHPRELAGVAIGTSVWIPILMVIMGIIMAVTPLVAHQYGARRNWEIAPVVHQAFYLAGLISIPVIILLNSAMLLLDFMKIEPEIRPITAGYLQALSFGILPFLGYNVLKSYSEGIGLTRPAMYTGVISLPVNIVLNYGLIFGHFGFPALGGVGAGWATAATFWVMFACMFLFTYRGKPYQPYGVYRRLHRFSPVTIWDITKLGVPIGATLFIEGSIFAIITLLMNAFGSDVVAAHQIAINFASFTFMVPLSLAMGLTVVVGQSVGAKKIDDAIRYARVGIGSAGLFMLFSAAIMLLFPQGIAALYTKDVQVQGLAVTFLMLAALFQLSDGVNVSTQGALRGLKDTTVSLIFNVIAFWVISLPFGYILAHTDWIMPALGARAYWISLFVGLTFSAVASVVRLVYLLRRETVSLSGDVDMAGNEQ
ncbi:MAG: MATE family efflux transporter [Bacillaceae bacterium]|nr:MATE family efflux transporter [Bacillaceae bacterium]